MSCLDFDRSWVYRELDTFYMRETDINEHFLAAVLQIFSNSADPVSAANLPSGSISRYCLIFYTNMLAQNVQQVLSDF